MSIYRNKRRSTKRQLGHLKLTICEDSSALKVTIYELRGLKKKENGNSETYVKLYILPDPLKQTKEKTKRIKERDPVFNETFQFILKEEDCNKRLFISVWIRERASRCEMVGCMSFLVSNIIELGKEVNGWYQLLDEVQGKVENIKVPGSLTTMGSMSSLTSTASAPPSITKNYAVTLIRSPTGYGFKVTPGSPVYINDITEGMPAHQSDIQIGDLILEVEGTDVTRADGDMVANMIKKQRETLQMILQRLPGPKSTSLSDFSLPLTVSQPFLSQSTSELQNHNRRMFLPSQPRRSSTGGLTQPSDMSSYDIDPQMLKIISSSRDKMNISRDRLLPELPEENSQGSFILNPSPVMTKNHHEDQGRTSLHGHFSLSQPVLESNYIFPPTKLHESGSISPTKFHYRTMGLHHHDNGRKLSTNSSLGSPSEEDLDGSGGLYNLAVQSVASSKLYTGPQPVAQPRSSNSYKMSTTSMASTDSAYNTEADGSPRSSLIHMKERSPSCIDTAQQHIHPASYFSGGNVTPESLTVEWESLSRLEQKRQKAIFSLVKCEDEFCEELKKGISTYLTPLSMGILSENSHRTIFMNLERMFDLSRYFRTQLSLRMQNYANPSSTSVPFYIDKFADIYFTKFELFKQIFVAYLRNSENSRKEIAISFMNPEFKRLVQVGGNDTPSIYSFVESGAEYLPKISRLLVNISYVTPLNHDDHKFLTNMIYSLIKSVLPPSCNDLKRNWMSEVSIMEKLKSSITFGTNVEAFDVMIPGRVLLHEGELHVVERKKKKKIWLLLFSDILLLTKRSGRTLTAIENPITLQEMLVQDINCGDDEFQICTSNGSLSRLLKASSIQVKGQWMQKLKERAGGSVKITHVPVFKDSRIKLKQKELKHELMKERKTPLKAPPPQEPIDNSPIHQINSSSGYPLKQAMGKRIDGGVLPSKFSAHGKGHREIPHLIPSKPKARGVFRRRPASVDISMYDEDDIIWGVSVGNMAMSQPITPSEGSLIGLTSKEKETKSRKKSSPDLVSLNKIPPNTLQKWSSSFDELLSDQVGIQLFEDFLRKECSEENILFWKACNSYKYSVPREELESEAKKIYSLYISHEAPHMVNIDHTVRDKVILNMSNVTPNTFDEASHSIYMLMQRDSYSRFLREPEFRKLGL